MKLTIKKLFWSAMMGALVMVGVAVVSMPLRVFTLEDAAGTLGALREQTQVLESLVWGWADSVEALAADDPMVFGDQDLDPAPVKDEAGVSDKGDVTGKHPGHGGSQGSSVGPKNELAPPATTWKGFKAAGEPTLDALRYEVYKAELQARLLKAQVEIRRAERDMKGIAERKEEKKEEKPVVILPPPKVKVLAMDPSGVVVEVDGVQLSFSRPGETKKGVEFVGVEGKRVIVRANGREGSGKF